MNVEVYELCGTWHFTIRTKNRSVIAVSARGYASRRNAVGAAKLLSRSKLKVVVE